MAALMIKGRFDPNTAGWFHPPLTPCGCCDALQQPPLVPRAHGALVHGSLVKWEPWEGDRGAGRLKEVSPNFLNGTGFVPPAPSALSVSWDSQVGRMFFVHFDVNFCLQETADDLDFLSEANLLLRVVKTAMLKSGTFHPAGKYIRETWNLACYRESLPLIWLFQKKESNFQSYPLWLKADTQNRVFPKLKKLDLFHVSIW